MTMKTFFYSLIVLLATTSIFAQEPLMKVYLQDGSVKTYNINEIEEMSFNNSSSEMLMKLFFGKSDCKVYPVSNISTINFTVGTPYESKINITYSSNIDIYPILLIDSIVFLPKPLVDMVLIPDGSFQMGNTGEYSGESDEKPVHSVTISKAFYMSKYEVTQKQYQAVMGTNPSNFKGENLPVEMVTWYNAVAFCNALSQLEGRTPCYTINGTNVTCNWDANGYRLPSEAEWEYAAKAGTTTDFHNGSLTNPDCSPLDNNLDKIGWYCGNENTKTREVGQKQPNAFGLYDMSGNVWEWCWDWYTSYTNVTLTDPKGPTMGSYRVYRGGSWIYYTFRCRSAYRNYDTPDSRYFDIGFRIVRVE